MLDYAIFPARADAEERLAEMAGWDAEPEELADGETTIWVIRARRPGASGDWSYLRLDGGIR